MPVLVPREETHQGRDSQQSSLDRRGAADIILEGAIQVVEAEWELLLAWWVKVTVEERLQP